MWAVPPAMVPGKYRMTNRVKPVGDQAGSRSRRRVHDAGEIVSLIVRRNAVVAMEPESVRMKGVVRFVTASGEECVEPAKVRRNVKHVGAMLRWVCGRLQNLARIVVIAEIPGNASSVAEAA